METGDAGPKKYSPYDNLGFNLQSLPPSSVIKKLGHVVTKLCWLRNCTAPTSDVNKRPRGEN